MVGLLGLDGVLEFPKLLDGKSRLGRCSLQATGQGFPEDARVKLREVISTIDEELSSLSPLPKKDDLGAAPHERH